MYNAAILTASDRCSAGLREDSSGKIIGEILTAAGFSVVHKIIVPDELEQIKNALLSLSEKADLVLTTGGTGFSPRDVTPEATKAVIEKEAPGIAEAIRFESMKYTDRAMLSRAVAGIRKKCVIINLPGSPKAVKEALSFILSPLSHGLDILNGGGECARK